MKIKQQNKTKTKQQQKTTAATTGNNTKMHLEEEREGQENRISSLFFNRHF